MWEEGERRGGGGWKECLQSVSHSSPLQDIVFIYPFHWRKWGQRWWRLWTVICATTKGWLDEGWHTFLANNTDICNPCFHPSEPKTSGMKGGGRDVKQRQFSVMNLNARGNRGADRPLISLLLRLCLCLSLQNKHVWEVEFMFYFWMLISNEWHSYWFEVSCVVACWCCWEEQLVFSSAHPIWYLMGRNLLFFFCTNCSTVPLY